MIMGSDDIFQRVADREDLADIPVVYISRIVAAAYDVFAEINAQNRLQYDLMLQGYKSVLDDIESRISALERFTRQS